MGALVVGEGGEGAERDAGAAVGGVERGEGGDAGVVDGHGGDGAHEGVFVGDGVVGPEGVDGDGGGGEVDEAG